jgi:hypothetical protein
VIGEVVLHREHILAEFSFFVPLAMTQIDIVDELRVVLLEE